MNETKVLNKPLWLCSSLKLYLSSHMASLVSSSSSIISRLTLLRKPSLHYSIKTLQKFQGHRKLSKLILPFLRASTNYVPFSSCPKAQTANSFGQDEELVVLGIETSCDDTAAAVVRSSGEILSQVVSSQAELLVRYGGVAPKMAEEAHSLVIDQDALLHIHGSKKSHNLINLNYTKVAFGWEDLDLGRGFREGFQMTPNRKDFKSSKMTPKITSKDLKSIIE